MRKFLNLCLVTGAALIIQGCASGSKGSDNSMANQNLITINNSGDVPILKDNQTTSEIYIHNNSLNVGEISKIVMFNNFIF